MIFAKYSRLLAKECAAIYVLGMGLVQAAGQTVPEVRLFSPPLGGCHRA